MKMNLSVFKKGKSLYWIIGGIVLFVLFYWIINRGGSSSGGGYAVAGGPSDAAVAASTQVALANTQASAGVAIATLQYNGTVNQTQAAADVAKYTASLDAATTVEAFRTQKEIAALNAEYSLDTARITSETNIAHWTLDANVLTHQMDTNAQMFTEQVKSVTMASLGNAAVSLGGNKGVRAFEALLVTSNNPQGLPVYNVDGNFMTGR